MHTHIIYYTTYKDVIVYIGAGQPNRYKHTTSGVSHVYQLNKLHFTDPENVNTTILKGCVSLEEALEEETKLIKEFKPKFNNSGLSSDERYSINKKEIEKYAGFCVPVITDYKYPIYNTIMNGREPSVKEAMNFYSDILTDNEVLYKAFPLFKEWIDSGVTLANMSTIKNKDQIQQLAISLREKAKISTDDFPFKAKQVYSKAEIKNTIQKFYDSKNIKIKAKATDIKKWYSVANTLNKARESSFKIIKKL